MKKKTGIYIHFPFCKRKCFYCHFLTIPQAPVQAAGYVDSVVEELGLRSNAGVAVDSVYVGGGSPSLMEEKNLFSIMEALDRNFYLSADAEISIECNPEECSGEKFKILMKAGFNRLSIGIQSFQEDDLRYLSRNHSREQCIQAIVRARDAGFSNINADLIIGLPPQSEKTLESNFDFIRNLPVSHVSCYLLEDCPKKSVSEKRQLEFYNFSRSRLNSLGFCHYEVSSFSRPGFECRHNLRYWQNQDYIGIGLGASGYENETDYQNHDEMDLYQDNIRHHRFPLKETRSSNTRKRKIVTGLRLMDGISGSSFDFHERELAFLLSENLLSKKGDRVAVNPEKILLLNEILAYFI